MPIDPKFKVGSLIECGSYVSVIIEIKATVARCVSTTSGRWHSIRINALNKHWVIANRPPDVIHPLGCTCYVHTY